MSLVDEEGRTWSFEFCFWYSKESRIYYFKRFYPYVQARNLRGGDTGEGISLDVYMSFSLLIFFCCQSSQSCNIRSPLSLSLWVTSFFICCLALIAHGVPHLCSI